MKHLKRFNSLNESHTQENEVDIIIDSMRDFLDDDRNILFKSSIDNMTYQDYISKNSNYLGFKPVVNTGNMMRYKFIIVFKDIKDYQDFLNISTQMQSVMSRLKDEDWSMYDMKLQTSAPPGNVGDIRFSALSFYFSKPDQRLSSPFKPPTLKQLNEVFVKYSLVAQDFELEQTGTDSQGNIEAEMKVEFDSLKFLGEYPQNIDDCFELVCDKFGFESYTWQVGNSTVAFQYVESSSSD